MKTETIDFKSAIISGATCLFGLALVDLLTKNGVKVLALCRKGSKRNEVLYNREGVTIKYCPLDELATLQNTENEKYDIFYHFAWELGDGRNDLKNQIKNVQYHLDAVDVAKRFGCHTFIGAGSQAEYGRCDHKINSNTPTSPENAYGIMKLCSGQMSRLYAHQLGIKHIWVRILSVYGAYDRTNTMISTTIEKLSQGEKVQFTLGEQLWDYLNCKDAAEAYKLIAEKGKDNKIYVLGSGEAYPLNSYIKTIANCMGADDLIELGRLPYAENQIMYLCADISELVKDTGWTPKISFEEGIKDMLQTLKLN